MLISKGHPTLTDFGKMFTEKPQFRGIVSRGLGLGHMARLRLFVLALYRVLVHGRRLVVQRDMVGRTDR